MVKIAYARQIGTYHMTSGLPCQDYVGGYYGDNCAVIALADGAGSYENSEIASEAVVSEVLKAVGKDFDYWYYGEDVQIRDCLFELSQKAAKDMNETAIPSTTLLLYGISNDDRELIIHIGDGYIFGVDYGGTPTTLSLPENGDEPNQTFFLSDENSKDHLRITRGVNTDMKGVMLVSDGVAASLVDQVNGCYAPAITKLIQMVEKSEEAVASTIIERELNELFRIHSLDDMSIGILVKTTEDRN